MNKTVNTGKSATLPAASSLAVAAAPAAVTPPPAVLRTPPAAAVGGGAHVHVPFPPVQLEDGGGNVGGGAISAAMLGPGLLLGAQAPADYLRDRRRRQQVVTSALGEALTQQCPSGDATKPGAAAAVNAKINASNSGPHPTATGHPIPIRAASESTFDGSAASNVYGLEGVLPCVHRSSLSALVGADPLIIEAAQRYGSALQLATLSGAKRLQNLLQLIDCSTGGSGQQQGGNQKSSMTTASSSPFQRNAAAGTGAAQGAAASAALTAVDLLAASASFSFNAMSTTSSSAAASGTTASSLLVLAARRQLDAILSALSGGASVPANDHQPSDASATGTALLRRLTLLQSLLQRVFDVACTFSTAWQQQHQQQENGSSKENMNHHAHSSNSNSNSNSNSSTPFQVESNILLQTVAINQLAFAGDDIKESSPSSSASSASNTSAALCAVALLSPPIRRALAVCRERLTHLAAAYYAAAASGRVLVASSPLRLTSDAALHSTRPLMTPAAFTIRAWGTILQALTVSSNSASTSVNSGGAKKVTSVAASSSSSSAEAAVWRTRLQLSQVLAGRHSGGAVVSRSELVALRRWMARFAGLLTTIAQQQQQSQQQGGEGGSRRGGAGGRLQALQAAASITSLAQLSTVFVTGALAAHTAAAVTAAGGRRPRGTAFSDSSSSGEEDNTASTTTATSPSLQPQLGTTSLTADAMMLGGEEGLLKRSGLFCPATASTTHQPSVLSMTNNMNAPLLQPLCVMPAIPSPSMSESVSSAAAPPSTSSNASLSIGLLKMSPSSALFDKMASVKGRDNNNNTGEGAGDRDENGPLFPVFGGGAASKQSSVSAAATVAALVALTAAASGAAFTSATASASSQQHSPKTPPGLAGMLLDLLAPLVPTSSSASGSGDAAAAAPPVSSSTSNAQASSSSVPHPTPAQLLELLGEAYGGLATKLLAPDLFSQATAGNIKTTTASNAVGGSKSQQRGGGGGAPLSPSAAQLDGPDGTTAGGGGGSEGANEDGGGDDTSTNNNTQKATATRRVGPASAAASSSSSTAASSSSGAAATFLADHSAFLSGQYAMTLAGITAGALEVTEACVVVPPILAGALFGSNAASPASLTTTATATHPHKTGSTGGATSTPSTTAATPIVGGSSTGEGVWAASASPFSTEGIISRLLLTPAFAEMYHAEVRRQGTSTTSSGATGSSMTTSTSPPPPQPVVSDLSSKAAQQLYQQQLLQITQSVREVLQPLLEQPHSSTLQPLPSLPASASSVSGSSGGGGQTAAGGGAGSGKVGKTSSTTAGTRHTSTTTAVNASSSKVPRQGPQRPPAEVLAVQHQLQGEWRRWWARLEGRDEQVRRGVVRLQSVFEEAVEGLRQREQERLAAAHNAALADLQRRYEEQQQQALLAKQQQQATASLAAAALQAQSSFSLSTALGGPQLPPRQPSQQLHSPSKQRAGGGGKGKDNKDTDDPNALEPAVVAQLLEAHNERVQGQEAHYAAMTAAVDSLVDTLSDAAHAALSSTELPTEQHMLSDTLKALAEEVMANATLTLSLRSNNNYGSSPLGSPQQANLSGPNSARGGGEVLPHSARGSKTSNNKGAAGSGGKRGGGGGPLDGSSGAAGDDGAIDDATMSPSEAAGTSGGGGDTAAAAKGSSKQQQQPAPTAANTAGGGAPRKGGGKGGATNDETPPQPSAGLQPPPFAWDMAAARRVLRRMLQQSPLLTTPPPSSASADQPQQLTQTQTQSNDPANATNTTANAMLLQLVAGDVARATWGLGRLTAAAATLLQLGLFGDHPSRHHHLQKEGDAAHNQDEHDDDEGTDDQASSKSGAGWRRCDRFMADLLVNTTTSTAIGKKENDYWHALYGPVRVGVASQTALDGRLLALCGGPRLLGQAYADLHTTGAASPVNPTTTSTAAPTASGVGAPTDGLPPLLRRLSMLLSCWYAAAGSHAAAAGTSTNGHLPPLALQQPQQHLQQNINNTAAAGGASLPAVDSASLLWFGAGSGNSSLPLFQAMGLYLGLSLPPPPPPPRAASNTTAAAVVPPPNPLVLSPLAAHRGVCCCSGLAAAPSGSLSSSSSSSPPPVSLSARCPFCTLVARRSTTGAGGQRLVTPLPIVRYDVPVPARDGSPSTMTVTLVPSIRMTSGGGGGGAPSRSIHALSHKTRASGSISRNSIMDYAQALRAADLALRRHACLPASRCGSTNPCPMNALTTVTSSSHPAGSSGRVVVVVGNTVGAGGGCYPPWESFSPANAANAANRRLLIASASSSSATPTTTITAASALAESTTATESTTSLLLAPKVLSLDKCVAAAVSEITTTTTTSTTSTASTNGSSGRGRRSSCGRRRRGRSGCGSDDDDDSYHDEEHPPPHAPAVLSVAMGNLPSSMAVSAAAATTMNQVSSLSSPPSLSSASSAFTPLVASLLLAGTTETCWYRYEPFSTTAADMRPDPASSASATTVEGGEVRLPPPTPALLNIVAMIDALTGIVGNGCGSINSKATTSAAPPATTSTTTGTPPAATSSTTTPLAVVIDLGCDGANYTTLTHLLRDVGLVLAARQRLYSAQEQHRKHQQVHVLPPSVRVAVLFDVRPLVMQGPMLGGTERCRHVVNIGPPPTAVSAAAVLDGSGGSTMPAASSRPFGDDAGGGAVSRSNSSSIGRSGGGGGGASTLPPTSPYTPRGSGNTQRNGGAGGPSTTTTENALVVLDRAFVGTRCSSTVTVAAGHGSLLTTCGIVGPRGVEAAGGTAAPAVGATSGHADMRHSEKAAISSSTTAIQNNNNNNRGATAPSTSTTSNTCQLMSSPSCDGGPSPAGFWLHLATWLGIDGVLLPPPTSGHATAAYNELSRIHEAVTALHHAATGPQLDATVNVADACCFIAPA